MVRLGALLLSLGGDLAAGHGHLNHPASRQLGSPAEAGSCKDGQCLWFSQPAHIPGKPTLNEAKYRTYNVDVSHGGNDWTATNPWRAPGAAPVYGSGCGAAGGGPTSEHNGGFPFPSFKQGQDSLTIPPLDKSKWTTWHRGEVVEAMYAINANHGGGYSYRLCKKTENVTEECFQRTPLQFVGSKSWVQYGDDSSNRTEIPLVVISEGTFPAGSQWARIPIPACQVDVYCEVKTPGGPPANNNKCGGYRQPSVHSCPSGKTQFPSPAPGIMGFGGCDTSSGRYACSDLAEPKDDVLPIGFDYNIVDKLQIPTDIEAGEYLLSWRWDCEQSAQIWQTCADVIIADPTVQV